MTSDGNANQPTNQAKGFNMTDKSYSVLCTGLYVFEEQDWDQSTSTDEYYAVLTTMVKTSDGKVMQKTVRVPATQSAWENMDTGSWKRFDALLWDGPLDRFGVGAQLFEEDDGSSEKNRKLISEAAKAAIAAGESGMGFSIPDALEDVATDALPLLLGLGDDKIDSYQMRYFNSTLAQNLINSPQKKSKPEGIPYRFRSEHRGGGGWVRMYYDITPS
jgi:hypothetical protein